MSERSAQELYAEYQGLGQQAQRIQQYLEQVTGNLGELANVIEALVAFAETEPGTAALAPIANGIFVETTLKRTTTVRMNVGAKVVVEKSVDEARAILEGQRKDLEAMRERAQRDLQAVASRLRGIELLIETEEREEEADGTPGPDATGSSRKRKA